MKPTRNLAFSLLVALITMGMASCTEVPSDDAGIQEPDPNQPIEDLDATLQLAVHQAGADAVSVDLRYAPRVDAERPRAVEVHLQTTGLDFLRGEPLDAAINTQKQVVAQAKDADTVRIVVFSTASLDRLQAGEVARLHFRPRGDADVTVQVIDRRPVFAPAAADAGVILPKPLTIPMLGGE